MAGRRDIFILQHLFLYRCISHPCVKINIRRRKRSRDSKLWLTPLTNFRGRKGFESRMTDDSYPFIIDAREMMIFILSKNLIKELIPVEKIKRIFRITVDWEWHYSMFFKYRCLENLIFIYRSCPRKMFFFISRCTIYIYLKARMNLLFVDILFEKPYINCLWQFSCLSTLS